VTTCLDALAYDAVFFDFEGTLNDTAQSIRLYAREMAIWMARLYPDANADWSQAVLLGFHAMRRLQDEVMPDISTEDGYRAYRRLELRTWLVAVLGHAGIAAVESLDLDGLAAQLESEIAPRMVATTGAIEAVGAVAAGGLRLFVSSGANSGYVRRCLKGAGLASSFTEVYGPDRIGTLKTGPDFYIRCFDASGVTPERALVVDDSPEPLVWATALGAQAIAVGIGDSLPAPRSGRRRIVAIGNLGELPAVLRLVK